MGGDEEEWNWGIGEKGYNGKLGKKDNKYGISTHMRI